MTRIARRAPAEVVASSAPSPWTVGDTTRAVAWMTAGIAARSLLLARIEGALDHDQSIVGLMALDIASGRRWPVFFDGQRYMGAVEAYVAAGFVAAFGHSPTVVALAPLLFFGLFAAGQYALWRLWAGRATGHLAALVTVLTAPMLALWSIVPRGGYIEILAWALLVLGIYRRVIRPVGPPLSKRGEAAWGFLLAFGYFLNPLSLIVYLTMALDWTFGRHGLDLRRERGLDGGWVDSRARAAAWLALATGAVVALALCCHVDFRRGEGDSPFVFAMDRLPTPLAAPLGVLGVAGVLGAAAWWSGAGRRILGLLASHASFTAGMIAGWGPFVLNNWLVSRGILPWNKSLPIWIRAPWDLGPNLRDGRRALGPLVGCSPEAPATLLLGQGVELPPHAWPALASALAWASPLVIAGVAVLIATVAWRDRRAWGRFWGLKGAEPTPPTVLALLGLGVTAALYLLQATSLNASSIRYLIPAWVVLPGLLASALMGLPARARGLALVLLLGPWAVAQANLWADLDRPSPHRPLTRELQRRGVAGIVAQTPVALMVANLSHGRVGAVEYRPLWPRLRDRYADRIRPEGPVTCVVDRDFPWPAEGGFGWSPRQDLGRDLRALAEAHPGRVRLSWQVGHFEVWDVDLPLSDIGPDDGDPLPPSASSAKVGPAPPASP